MKFLTNKIVGVVLSGAAVMLTLGVAGTAHAQAVSAGEIAAALERQRAAMQDGSRGSVICEGAGCAERGIQLYDEDAPSAAAPEKVITAAPSASTSTSGTTVTPQRQTAASSKPARTKPASSGYTSKSARRVPVKLPKLPEGQRLDLVILFEFDSAFIRPASRPQLQALCDAISTMRTSDKFAIIGHTDASGGAQYNFNLSKRRAQEVRRHLITECDVSGDRLQAFGFGEERLLEGIAGRSDKQRRVEIQLNLSS